MEFGDVGIDGEILKGCGDAACPEENIVELANATEYGLSAAVTLAMAGLEVTVHEAAGSAGGGSAGAGRSSESAVTCSGSGSAMTA